MPVVLVTEGEYKRAETVFATAPGVQCTPAPREEAELARAIAAAGARYVVVGSYPYASELYSTLPRGGVIARFGVGHETVDKAKATKAGLLCTNTPGVLDRAVAEHAILLMVEVDAENVDAAFLFRQQPDDRAREHGFARSGSADETKNFTPVDVESDAVEDPVPFQIDNQVVHFDDWSLAIDRHVTQAMREIEAAARKRAIDHATDVERC